jgi:hypothetical protein
MQGTWLGSEFHKYGNETVISSEARNLKLEASFLRYLPVVEMTPYL